MKYTVSTHQTLFDALLAMAPGSSRNTLRKWLQLGRITVDGKKEAHSKIAVQPGQIIELADKEKKEKGPIDLLYSDKHLVVIDKSAGLLSVATEKGDEISAHWLLKKHFYPKKVFVVHRLDKGTSGVMLFALSEEGFTDLKEQLAKREMKRKYTAILEGSLKENGKWESYLWEDKNFFVHSSQDPKAGQRAVTHYLPLRDRRKYTLAQFTLETGRKHQIRVHCKEAGHLVVGDRRYGSKKNPIKRLCLHASHLEFVHPISGKKLSFDSPVPQTFLKLFPSEDHA